MTSEHLLFNSALYENERTDLITKVGIRYLMTDLFYENILINRGMYQACKEFDKNVLDKRRGMRRI